MMRVRAKIPFVSKIDGLAYRPAVGDVIEMPEGADWVKAGLVEPVDEGGGGRIAGGEAERREVAVIGPKEARMGDEVLRPGHVDDLTIVPGIGPRTAEALVAMGIRTLGDLASCDVAGLAAALDGSSERQVRKWVAWLADDAQA